MLSTTNQPRSSKVSAAWLRPAPDSPVMMRKSAIAPPIVAFFAPLAAPGAAGGATNVGVTRRRHTGRHGRPRDPPLVPPAPRADPVVGRAGARRVGRPGAASRAVGGVG